MASSALEDPAAALRAAADERPEPYPAAPRDAMRPRRYRELKRDGYDAALSGAMASTARWLTWRAEVLLRNRARLGSLLWACAAFRVELERDPSLSELTGELRDALAAFGWPEGARVPESALARRRLVEAWGTAAWWDECQAAWEAR